MKTESKKEVLKIYIEETDNLITYRDFMTAHFDKLVTASENQDIIIDFNNAITVAHDVSAVLVLLNRYAQMNKRTIIFKNINPKSPLGNAIKTMKLNKILNIEE